MTGYNEAWLQHLLADHPQALPITEIEPFLEKAVPICLELNTKAGPIDLLLVSPRGDIVVVECKLWRNPQARREVVGQILDYAKELPHLSYEGFEAEIFKAQPANGAQKADPLYVRTGAEAEGLTEHEFIDAVSRNLRRGRFLLLIVGDGIQEGVEAIADFLQQHAGMHFTLALVEMAIFKREPEGYIVQPRILARTQMVPRGVVAIQDNQIVVHPGAGTMPTSIIGANGKPASFAAAMPATISETRLYEQLDAHTPPLANRLRAFVNMLDEVGVNQRFTATMIVLEGVARETSVYLAHLDVKYANIWFGDVIKQAASLGRKDAALRARI